MNRQLWRLGESVCHLALKLFLSLIIGVLTLGAVGFAQAQNDDQSFHVLATRAIAYGDSGAAQELVESRGDNDPFAVALAASLLVRHGSYSEAESLLLPVADRAPDSAAGLEYGLLLQRLGRRGEAQPYLEAVMSSGIQTNGAHWRYRGALAARALGDFRGANQLIRAAAAASPDDPAVQTVWGELFLEKYNQPDALESFQAAITLDDKWAPAHLGIAQVLANENPPVARSSVDRVLELDSENIDGHLFVAELELDDRNREAAREAIDVALRINPNSLEAHALLAAIAFLEDRMVDFDAEVSRTLEINPNYGDVFRIVGNHVARAYRFPEAVELVRRALRLEPDNLRAHAELGMHLLRTGDEPAARLALERSFEGDPFDIVTYNLLEMLDQLDGFETFEQGDLIVRLHPDESEALKDYVLELAQQAIDELSERYQMMLKPPILVEVFPRHDDFAVRNLGLPGMIGALGACFGSVVTMDSPRARPPGDFNWQSTLWHEMAHVITLQMSNQRLPRWLSEGISTYEEKRKHLSWGRDAVLEFASALNDDSLLSIRDLNSGFTRPETINLSYFQASVLVEHIINEYGMESLQRLLLAYGDGLETAEALTRIGLSFEELQSSFDDSIDEQFGALSRALSEPESDISSDGQETHEALRLKAIEQEGNYHVQLALGRSAYAMGENSEARAALNRASSLVPMATGFDSPHGLLAKIAQEEGDLALAMQELELLLEYDETSIEAVRLLASLAEEMNDARRLQIAYERLIEIDPFDPIPHQVLGRFALEDGRIDVAILELTVALSLGPVDRVAVYSDLAEGFLAAEQFDQAKQQIMSALEVAPSYTRAQDLLLTIIEQQERQ